MTFVPQGYVLLADAIEVMVDHETKTSVSERADLADQERRLELWRGGPNDPQSDPLLHPNGPYRHDTRSQFPPEVAARLVAVRKVLLDHTNVWRACVRRMHQALGDGDLEAILMCSDGTLKDVPPAVWRREINELNFKEGFLAWQYGQHPHERIAGDVLLCATDFDAWRSPPRLPQPTKQAAASRGSTVAAETRLTAWLVRQMGAAPTAPRSKSEMMAAAREAGHEFSNRGFISRAWPRAIDEAGAPAWSEPGRKSKRRIDTPS